MGFWAFLVLLLPLFGLMALGFPVFVAMGIACFIFVYVYDIPIFLMGMSYVRGVATSPIWPSPSTSWPAT